MSTVVLYGLAAIGVTTVLVVIAATVGWYSSLLDHVPAIFRGPQ